MDETRPTRPSDAAPIAVLLVEDDPEHAALVARRLSGPRSERFDLDRAASLNEALMKLAERKSEHERSSSGTLGDDGEDAQPTIAELALRSLENGLVQGPFRDGEEER